jgi:hypothetical protein
MPANGWVRGTMYKPGGDVGAPGSGGYGYKQPGGPFTPVYPQQTVRPDSNIPPFSTAPTTNQTGQMAFGCGHILDMCLVYKDFDYETGMSVALICCPACTFISEALEPYEKFLDTFSNPVQLP